MSICDNLRIKALCFLRVSEVIEPEELRERVKESLTKTLAAYEGRHQPLQEESEIQEALQDYAG